MQITYCVEWNSILEQPREPLSPSETQRKDKNRLPYAVLVGDPTDPDEIININWGNDYVEVAFNDEQKRQWLTYSFKKVGDGLMFMLAVTRWQYPEDGPAENLNGAELIEEIRYRTDGVVQREIRDENKQERIVDEYDGVSLDINWEPVPEFGNWASLARFDRALPPERQPSRTEREFS